MLSSWEVAKALHVTTGFLSLFFASDIHPISILQMLLSQIRTVFGKISFPQDQLLLELSLMIYSNHS